MAEIRPNIWQLQSRHDVAGLSDALQHPDREVRKRAALALHTLDATLAVPVLRAALQREQDEHTLRTLKSALRALVQRTDIDDLVQRGDVHGLIEVLSSRHAENAVAAARALGTLGDRRAVEPLVILFQNSLSSPKVRLAAAEALLELQSAPAVVTLLGALRRDSWQVRRNAAAVLGQIQAVWAVEPLIEALQDTHPVVRRTAAAALRRIGTADALQALRTQFTEGTLGKRKPAAEEHESPSVEQVAEPQTPVLPEDTPQSVPGEPQPAISEPPVGAEDTVPSDATRARRGQDAWRQAAERVTLSSAETPLARSAVVPKAPPAKPKSSRVLGSVRRLIDFLNR